jgi:hypothetical protein
MRLFVLRGSRSSSFFCYCRCFSSVFMYFFGFLSEAGQAWSEEGERNEKKLQPESVLG